MADEGSGLTLRRLEAPVHKFIKVALPTDLERLHKHHSNILKFQASKQWDRLHQEHINASRTVQQLRANMSEMEKLCARVRPEDAAALEKLVRPVRDRASTATRDFLLLCSNATPQAFAPSPPPDEDPGAAGPIQAFCLPEIPADQCAAESWDSLEEDLRELNSLVTEFSLHVHSQQEKIDRIEDNVNTASANVVEGTNSLGKALGYKLMVLPVAGALLGGALGGPLGLLAGYKVAGVAAALGGGALGFTGGKLVQSRRKKQVEVLPERPAGAPDQNRDRDRASKDK